LNAIEAESGLAVATKQSEASPYFIVRHNVSTNTTLTTLGAVVTAKLCMPLRTQATVQQDNYLGLLRPNSASLNECGLVSSGAFAASPLPGSRTDELLVFDNSVVQKNKSSSSIYYYWNGAWRRVGSGSADVGLTQIFIPGTGVIIRKSTNVTSSVWVNVPNW
jgi:uncharacterized protein (TIGR02597 family)